VDRSEITALSFITHASNLPSILEHGILSHSRAADIEHRSVAMEEIQERRSAIQVPNGLRLHDYANLYINPRNPMMYKVALGYGHRDLLVLKISPTILDLTGTVVCDMNAARSMVRFGTVNEMVPLLDGGRIFARYWAHSDDQIDTHRHKGEMCAEVLVPDVVDPMYINSISVSCETARAALHRSTTLPVEVDEYLFFEGEPR
jgi:hypothetical protein